MSNVILFYFLILIFICEAERERESKQAAIHWFISRKSPIMEAGLVQTLQVRNIVPVFLRGRIPVTGVVTSASWDPY